MNRGSITIEMAVIMPFVFIILTIIIYTGIYLHDLSYLQAKANDIAVKIHNNLIGSNDYKKRLDMGLYFKNGIVNEIDYIVKKNIDNKGFIKKGEITYQFNISNKLIYKEVFVQLKKEFSTPFSRVNNLFFGGEQQYIKANSNIKFYSPTQVVNNVELINDLTSEIKVTKQLKDKYYDYIDKIKDVIKDW